MASIFDRINSIPENKNTAAPVATPTPSVSRGTTGSTGSITDRISAIPTTEKEDSKTESSKRESIWDRIKSNLGYVGESGKVGLFEGTEGVINEMGYLGQNAFDGVEMQQAMQAEAWAKVLDWLGIGDGKAAERQARTTESVRENLESGELVDVASFGDKAAQELTDKYGEQKGVTKFAGDIARGAGQLIPGVAASAVTGVPGLGIATSALSAAGNATQEAKKAGADDSKAMGYGLLTGGIEAGTEALFGGMGGIFGKGARFPGKSSLDDLAMGIIEQRIRSEGAQKVLKALVSAGFEGAEEVVAEIAQRIANEATVNTDDRGIGETFKDALYSGAVGAALGGVGDAIGAGVRGIRNAPTTAQSPQAEAEPAARTPVPGAPTAQPTSAVDASGQTAALQPAEQADKNFATGAAALGELTTPFSEWRDNSTAPQHEMGEKATRYLGVPTQDRVDPNKLTMKTPQTVAEAAVTTDENAARIENAYVNGDYSYVPVVNERLSRRASASIEDKGWDTALKDWTAAVRGGKVNPQLVAEGAVLINNAGNTPDASAKTYADLVLDYANLLHNAGQALQASRILKMLTPEGRLYGIQRSVQRMSEDMAKYLQKQGIEKVEVPEALFEEYRNAQDDAARDAVVEKMQQAIADQLPGTWMEKWTALRYVNMLGNFKTQIRNVLGNATMQATYALKNQVANLVEAVASKASNGKVERTKAAFVGGDWMKAAKADYAGVKDAVLGNGKYNDQDITNDFERGVQEKRRIFQNLTLEGYRNVTNWAMEKGDVIFSKGIYARTLAGYLKAKGYSPAQLADGSIPGEVLDNARTYAIKEAQEATFRDNNAFSSWISKIGRRSDTHPLGKIAAEGLAPFRKTPANVMLRAEEFSPLGIVNTVVTAVKAGRGQASVNDVINSASKVLTGSAMVGLGWLLADMGVLRGVPDEDEQAAGALMNFLNFAWVFPDGSTYTLDWAVPASLLLFTGVAMQAAYSDGDLSWRDIEGALTSLTEPMVQMSMLSGISDTLDSIKFSDNNLLQMAGTLAASYLTQGLTNTLLGQIERTSEPARMTTYTETDSPLPDWLQRTIGKASAKTPGLDFQQTEYLDEFGNTESNGNIGRRILENFISPGYFDEGNQGKPAYDFAYEMNQLLGYNAFPDPYTDREITHDGTKYQLTQEQREQWQKERGETAEAQLTAASNNRAFDILSDEQKRDVLEAMKAHANEQGKNSVLEDMGIDIEQSDLDKARASLRAGDFVTYYSILTAYNDVADGATREEMATLEQLLQLGRTPAIENLLTSNSGFANMLEAYNAGVSIQSWSVYDAAKAKLGANIPAGYGGTPNWQRYNSIGSLSIPEEEKLVLISGIDEKFGNKVQEAINQGVSLSDVLAYYEAITARNADGSEKNKAQKNNATQALNLGDDLFILNRIFK